MCMHGCAGNTCSTKPLALHNAHTINTILIHTHNIIFTVTSSYTVLYTFIALYIPIPTLHSYTLLQYNYSPSTYTSTSLLIPIHILISSLIGGRLYRLVILLHHYNYTILKRFLYIFHYCYSLLIHS